MSHRILAKIAFLVTVTCGSACSSPHSTSAGTSDAHKDLQDVATTAGFIQIEEKGRRICVHFLSRLTCEIQTKLNSGEIDNTPSGRCWIMQSGTSGQNFQIYHQNVKIASIQTEKPYKRDRTTLAGLNGGSWTLSNKDCTDNAAPAEVNLSQ